jgi:hypothetical protein
MSRWAVPASRAGAVPAAVRSFPRLGWDPTPGDVERTHGVARQVSELGYELGTLVAQLDGMDDGA